MTKTYRKYAQWHSPSSTFSLQKESCLVACVLSGALLELLVVAPPVCSRLNFPSDDSYFSVSG